MKHNDDGKEAEDRVAQYLKKEGYRVVDRNWKTKKCEIDIVASKGSCIYFVEVKYRSINDQGDGFQYITHAKKRQMAYAAEYWVAQNLWEGEYALGAASVGGPDFQIDFIDTLY